jgi:hypothetical protein
MRFLDRSFRALTDDSRRFLHCPKCTTSVVEVEYHTWSTKVLADYQPSDPIGLDRCADGR